MLLMKQINNTMSCTRYSYIWDFHNYALWVTYSTLLSLIYAVIIYGENIIIIPVSVSGVSHSRLVSLTHYFRQQLVWDYKYIHCIMCLIGILPQECTHLNQPIALRITRVGFYPGAVSTQILLEKLSLHTLNFITDYIHGRQQPPILPRNDINMYPYTLSQKLMSKQDLMSHLDNPSNMNSDSRRSAL